VPHYEVKDGRWTEKSLVDYLTILSEFECCELKGGSVLRLLLDAESLGAFGPQKRDEGLFG